MPDTAQWHRSVAAVVREIKEGKRPSRYTLRHPRHHFILRLECGHQKQVTAYRYKTQKAFLCEFCRYGE